MILGLLLACSSTPESKQEVSSTPAQQEVNHSKSREKSGSLFLTQCALHTSTQRNSTLNVIFDRLGSTDCSEAYNLLSTTKELDLSNHPTPFSDISILSEFTHLEELYLSDSQVSDLSPIANHTNLRVLHAEHCAIQNIDPLSRLSNLEDLLLDYTGVDDLSTVEKLTSLKRIGLRNTNVRSLQSLAGLTALASLEISGTSITSLEPLSKLNNLQIVSLRQTDVSDIQSLSEHLDLFFIDIKSTKVRDLSPLQHLSNIKVLDISNTGVTDLSPLQTFSSLIELNVQGLNIPEEVCRRFGNVIQGCSVENEDRLLKLCTSTDDFAFATQVSMRSLQKDLGESNCSALRAKVDSLHTFTSSEPYLDPRIFSFFPNLQRLDIPVEQVLYKYCSNDISGVLKELCTTKQNVMQQNAAVQKQAFITDCTTPNEQASVTYQVLKTKMGTASCEDLWDTVSMTEKLSLQRVNITNIEPFSRLPNLRDLSIDYNDIKDLSPLAKLTDLQILWVDDNSLEDLSPLKDLSLLWLSAGDNNIKDISPLTNSVNLQRLWLGGNHITDIAALKDLTNLRKLHLAINDIVDISPLSGLASLSSLYLGHNNIRSIEALHNLQGLKVLSSGLDYEESPLEMQRWFLQGNPINSDTCLTENAPSAVTLFCSQYN